MKIYKSLIAVAVVATFINIVSCSKDTDTSFTPVEPPSQEEEVTPSPDDGDVPSYDGEIYDYDGETATDGANDVVGTDKDLYWEANSFDAKVSVVYNGNSATVTSSSSKVESHIDGAHVVIDMLTQGASGINIEVSGKSDNGSLKIYGEKKYQLTLNGVELTSTKGPAINSQCKKRVFVYVADGKTNRLTDASTYSDDSWYIAGSTAADEDRKGCFFSEGHMIVSGKGVLVVAGKQKHGIACDGYMYLRPGTTIAVTEAKKNDIHIKGDEDDGIGVMVMGGLIYTNTTSTAGKGIKTDYNIDIYGGKLDLNTSGNAEYDSTVKDTSSASGMKADGDINIYGGSIYAKSSGNGGKGISCDGNLHVTDGEVNVVTTGGRFTYTSSITSSPKGIKADGNITIDGGSIVSSVTGKSEGSEGIESKGVLTINDGDIYAYAYDDAINAATDITINGGRIYAYASNNDGIDTNGSMTINGGLVLSSGSSSPEEAFDCDVSSRFKVNGGTLIGVAGGAVSPASTSTQCTVIYRGLSVSKGDLITVLNASGTPLFTFEMPRTLSSMALFFSSADLKSGQAYTIKKGGTISGATDSWNGWSDGGSWSGGSQIGTFTQNSMITTVGSSGGPGGNRW